MSTFIISQINMHVSNLLFFVQFGMCKKLTLLSNDNLMLKFKN